MEILNQIDNILINYPFLAIIIIYISFGLFVWFEVCKKERKNK